MQVSFGGIKVLFGSQFVDFGTLGPVGPGAAQEASPDSASSSGFYNPTNALRQYGVDPSTIITFFTNSLGSQLTGTPTINDRWLLPTTYLDGATTETIQWELDSNGNATGRILKMTGSGNSTNLPFKYWNGSLWFSATFSTNGTSQTISGTGATTESGADTASGSGVVRIAGNGAISEASPDTSSGSGVVVIAGAGAALEPSPDIVSGAGSVLISGSGAATEPATDSVSSSGTPVITGSGSTSESQDSAAGSGGIRATGSGASQELQDSASGAGTVYIPGAGAAQEASPDIASGSGVVPIAGTGSIAEPSPDTVSSTGQTRIAGSGSAQEIWVDTADGSGTVSGGANIGGSGATQEASPDVAKSTGVVSNSTPIPTPTPSTSSKNWIAQFRYNYPEFSSTALYPSSTIEYWRTVAYAMLNPARWMRQLDLAAQLFVAHNIVVEAKMMAESKNGGIPGFQVGILQSKTVDKVSGSYDINAAIEEGAGFWNMTVYGLRLYRLIKMFGAGPIQIMGGYSGAVMMAWSGPDTRPGMMNFGN